MCVRYYSLLYVKANGAVYGVRVHIVIVTVIPLLHWICALLSLTGTIDWFHEGPGFACVGDLLEQYSSLWLIYKQYATAYAGMNQLGVHTGAFCMSACIYVCLHVC